MASLFMEVFEEEAIGFSKDKQLTTKPTEEIACLSYLGRVSEMIEIILMEQKIEVRLG